MSISIDEITSKEMFEEWFMDEVASRTCGIYDKRDLPDYEGDYIAEFEERTGKCYDDLHEV